VSGENTKLVDVYRVLRESIATGAYRPRKHFRAAKIADELGISRTPSVSRSCASPARASSITRLATAPASSPGLVALSAELGDVVDHRVEGGFDRRRVAADLGEDQAALVGGEEGEGEAVGVDVGR
jgi:hypothetical protein